jgi:hypothetical protein
VLSIRASLAFVLTAVLAALPASGARVHHATSGAHAGHGVHAWHSARSRSASGSRHARGERAEPVAASHRLRGQQSIEPDRAAEIQNALIREHYLTVEQASGQWDATTEAAMQKFQADHGWQTKLMPDSRALKKLGLGPDYSKAINAQDSAFADPPPASTSPPMQSTGFASAAGVNQ